MSEEGSVVLSKREEKEREIIHYLRIYGNGIRQGIIVRLQGYVRVPLLSSVSTPVVLRPIVTPKENSIIRFSGYSVSFHHHTTRPFVWCRGTCRHE